MKNRLRFAALTVAAAVPLSMMSAAAAGASTYGYDNGYGYEQTGRQGCTPGYWKNHTSNWQEYRPTTRLSSVFALTGSPYASMTLGQALSFGGGSGVNGATQILLRAATAAVLNDAHDALAYPQLRTGTNGIIAQVNRALASRDRSKMLRLAATLDAQNNLGCPLN